jgi:hypothetical protein
MLSGRCIIAYGPKAIGPIAYAAQGGWAAVVDEPSVPALAARIRALADASGERDRLSAVAYHAGLEEHDLMRNATRFTKSLLALASLRVPEDGS